MSVESDTSEGHLSSGSSSGISSDSDSDTLGEGGVMYTPLNTGKKVDRTRSHRIHIERIQKYEESEHNLALTNPPSASETISQTESATNGPRIQFLTNPEPNASVNNSHSSLLSVSNMGKSLMESPVCVDRLTLNDDDNDLKIRDNIDLQIRPELMQKIPRAKTVSVGIKPIVETNRARMSISTSEKRYINQYLLQERLGRGCFGTVRKCKDITTGQTFAMKILNKKNLQMQLKYTWTANNKMETSSAFESVLQEISIMKRLRHRNILNLIEIIYSEDVLYLILEYMQHGSLAEGNHTIKKIDCEKGDKLRRYMRDMVSGLAYLHSQRICHSDIKPENILIGNNDILKLADFGISRFLDHGQSKRVFQEKEGTLAFQAPECLHESDTKFSLYPTDIWALGVTLYQLKYGYLPFYDKENERLMKKIVSEPIQLPPSEKDEDFINLIYALLDKDPSKRITVLELCDHPWITKRGFYEPLQTFYNVLSPRKQDEKVMVKLQRFTSARSSKPEIVKAKNPEIGERARSSRGKYSLSDFQSASNINAPIIKKSGDLCTGDLKPINETKVEESKLGPRLAKILPNSKSTRSLHGSQVVKTSAAGQAKMENYTDLRPDLERLVSFDADLTLEPLTRAITERVPCKRYDNTGNMSSVHNNISPRGATSRLAHKTKVYFQERKIKVDDIHLPYGFEEESKEHKSRFV